jgi:hypothetical protein
MHAPGMSVTFSQPPAFGPSKPKGKIETELSKKTIPQLEEDYGLKRDEEKEFKIDFIRRIIKDKNLRPASKPAASKPESAESDKGAEGKEEDPGDDDGEYTPPGVTKTGGSLRRLTRFLERHPGHHHHPGMLLELIKPINRSDSQVAHVVSKLNDALKRHMRVSGEYLLEGVKHEHEDEGEYEDEDEGEYEDEEEEEFSE